MKKNDFNRHIPASRKKEEWDELIDRYYEGLTTSQEERELCTFLFSNEADDPCYEEHRAVLAYTAMGRKYATTAGIPRSARPGHVLMRSAKRWISVAAVAGLLLATGISLYLHHSRNEVYVAYVYGRKYTSPEIVSEQMHQSFHNVSVPETNVEEELSEMFSELPQESTCNE